MTVNFDNFIKDRVVYYNPDHTMNDILSKLINNEWDIIAFRDFFYTRPNILIPLIYRDVITNIKTEDGILFCVIDNVEIPIRDDTRIITALSPLKIIHIKVKNTINDLIKITFTRLMLRNELINNLRTEIVYDNNFTYHDGEII